ncbi:DUF1003 domain-containing protein [Arthrobacter sp. STN4]|uniref:DUF1003 domain-containing protein n=1 Tax=Arthrobacter sp. STN4 TaxID=2923276 RepID=UPI002119D715|nr:DUF1003 domain-containing protein [Arthrobacter sp. STN4]MCQ9165386.1 DUF1003 domain-containing protein [Arthrobacter sp. STN4]
MAEKHHAKGGGLDTPLELRSRLLPNLAGDPDLFGRFAERFARYMGTANFLLYMTIVVVVWIALNVVGLFGLKWDPYPFILLNLFFSTQASYAAPLILLAQNRQDDRDRVQIEQDRTRNERNLADTEYLTREVAALRISLREVATRDFVRSELRSLLEELISFSDDDAEPGREPRVFRNPATQAIKTVPAKRTTNN